MIKRSQGSALTDNKQELRDVSLTVSTSRPPSLPDDRGKCQRLTSHSSDNGEDSVEGLSYLTPQHRTSSKCRQVLTIDECVIPLWLGSVMEVYQACETGALPLN
ncbi:hypothetical protein BaRGS_00004660 [Batillaria attramentaria]|uniref:Uncharacterized protein n=1 Tax=Batillaria attramentaria TaxID=370345 RepID=A0ABD0LXS2_9CAEN